MNKTNENIHNKQSLVMKIIPYIFCFFIFSFIGWVLETIYCFGILQEPIVEKRGFLYAPICPIYRCWSIISYSIFRLFKK